MINSIEEAKQRNAEIGQFWFSPDAMRFFSTRLSRRVYPVPEGMYFVSSERFDDRSPRLYTVRFVADGGMVSTVGEFQQYGSAPGAHLAARACSPGAAGVKRLTNRQCETFILLRQEFSNHGHTFWGRCGTSDPGLMSEPWRTVFEGHVRRGIVDFTVLSYATPIAWHCTDGEGWVIPDVRYSSTISRHQNIVRRTVGGATEAHRRQLMRNIEETEARLARHAAERRLRLAPDHIAADTAAMFGEPGETVPDSADIVARINEALRWVDERDATLRRSPSAEGDDFEPDNGAAICPPPGRSYFAVSGEAAIYSMEYLRAKYGREQCT